MIRLWVWFANSRWCDEFRIREWIAVTTMTDGEWMAQVRTTWQRKGYCTAIERVKA